jgi:hypothetical protein
MPLTRWIISSRASISEPAAEAIVNTLYFNVSDVVGDGVDWEGLGDDLMALWKQYQWAMGRFLDIRGYDMDDPEPRQQKYLKREQNTGTAAQGPRQVAVCLSYYADRNLPRQRGRIYLGPWTTSNSEVSSAYVNAVMTLPPALAGLGGVNVDWSLWSPTTQTHTRINHAWCDNSWDIIRSRKLPATAPRVTWTGNG